MHKMIRSRCGNPHRSGLDPEAGWSPQEANGVREGIEALTRRFNAAIGAPVSDLELKLRGHARQISRSLEDAADATLAVIDAGNNRITARGGDDDERAA